MKIAVAQIKPEKGNIQKNLEIHKTWIELAISEHVDFIVFPELSLTGYEPKLARELVINKDDSRLDEFKKMSNLNHITIGLGAPTESEHGIHISMILSQPNQNRKVYTKQQLHSDELPYFVEGNEPLVFTIKNKRLTPAICYESLQPKHIVNAKNLGSEFYVASVAKSQNGIEKAYAYYPMAAKKFSMPILMSNSIGFCDNFQSAGQSGIWDSNGELIAKLQSNTEGMLLFDTETKVVIKKEKNTIDTL